MATHYTSSKGQRVEIAAMPYPYLTSALAKLIREQKDGERQAEIDAMRARVAVLDAEYAAKKAAEQ